MPLVPLALRRDPAEVLASLAGEPGAFLLDVPEPARPVTLVGCAPRAVLRIEADTREDPFAAIARFVAETPVDPALPFPLAGGVVGWLAYELGAFSEPAAGVARPGAAPLAVLARPDPLLVFDRTRGQWALASVDPAAPRAPWLERLSAPVPEWTRPLAAGPLVARREPAGHRGAVRRILDYLAAGDAYQVNLTLPFEAPLAGPAWALYARLAHRHPTAYGAYLDAGDARLVANSPELFLRRRGPRVETRPIKGTRPRGASAAADAALVADLTRDPKERAEHVMIVDLERNDLGRVAVPGSVAVEGFARVETHATLHHLVSTVAARVPPDLGLAALLRATFPGGSITGAPKVRAMQIIQELEPDARGAYTGAFGLFHPAGDVELGLAIRTGLVADGVVRWHAGGGIVADSDPERELAEAWLKTAALRLALGESAPALEQCSSG
ncbi:MAG TPA: anthranilate synthase component I family protein [Candidatus Binatia bacterium]|nr:anthranilate synthase component I family protein [Candidatus Binatia bacterium]